MKFTETKLRGAYVIEPEPDADERGFFARTWSRLEFAERGLDPDLSECAISFNHRSGTLRGLHYQVVPFEETKLVRCTAGAIYDVIVDLRADSQTRGAWQAFELSAANRRLLYVPKGFAHGFQTIADNTEVHYQLTGRYAPSHARGIRWDDPALGVEWPAVSQRIMSSRDRQLPVMQAVQ
ncbi:MAG TPA: dTDP-4-dehydrorhamnose 3,5-epimerase [Candidatus Dormibacteraeota bacterium]